MRYQNLSIELRKKVAWEQIEKSCHHADILEQKIRPSIFVAKECKKIAKT